MLCVQQQRYWPYRTAYLQRGPGVSVSTVVRNAPSGGCPDRCGRARSLRYSCSVRTALVSVLGNTAVPTAYRNSVYVPRVPVVPVLNLSAVTTVQVLVVAVRVVRYFRRY